VLIPTLDDNKHYWIGPDEVDKLMHRGGDWLPLHPDRELIVNRYLKGLRRFTSAALDRLAEDTADAETAEEEQESAEEAVERRLGLGAQRVHAVLGVLKGAGASRVLDLGCGEGRLLRALLDEHSFAEIVGVDVSMRVLQRAKEQLKLERRPRAEQARLKLLHSSLTYRDARLGGYDAAAVVEVVEHLDPTRLAAFERSLFEYARPGTVALTTPNADYNVRFETLPAGQFRHADHRFEWSRDGFRNWATAVGDRFGYSAEIRGIGPEDSEVGSPTQMAVFSR
jgi:3' terminal RNA ribose 2'-O-methyltransferase Hen1